ncbi:MAG: hypothetical protein U0174_17930 [Polyangiaceae bacterium]
MAFAHQEGEEDPKGYATLLERVGTDSRDPAYAAHWLSESAHVWMSVIGDAPRAARLLMTAVDRDPTHRVSADRLAELYRNRGEAKALAALLDRRARALAPMATSDAELRNDLAGMHEELGRLFSEAPLSQPRKAIEHFKKAAEYDPQSAYAIFSARELMKSAGMYQEAIPLYAAELAIEADEGRKLALLRDEAETCKLAGDLAAAGRALAQALDLGDEDPALKQEYAELVLSRAQSGADVGADERARAVHFLGALASEAEGEHGLAYAAAALELDPGDDVALGAYANQAGNLGRDEDIATRYAAYLKVNPNGAHADAARRSVGEPGGGDATAATDIKVAEDLARERAKAAARGGTITGTGGTSTGSGVKEKQPPREDPLAMFANEAAQNAASSMKRPSNIPADRLQGILDAAQMLAGKGKRTEAYVKYREVLENDPSHPEALAWIEDYLRGRRDYPQLKDVLLASVRAMGTRESVESKKERLREVAGLCEGQLRDVDGAVSAWRQLIALDRSDESARNALLRLLERSNRFDDIAKLLEQEATIETDIETKISLEKKLARLQEDKRKDLVGAAEAWGRIARLQPEAEIPIATASKLYERADKLDLAAQVIAETAPLVEDPMARGNLFERLAQLRETMGELVSAGESYAEAAEALRNGRLWEEAERLFAASEEWEKAANAAAQRGELTSDLKVQASFRARGSEYLVRAGDEAGALRELEIATDLDPLNDSYADQLSERFSRSDQHDRLVQFLTRRGERLVDRLKRVSMRRQAATIAAGKLRDRELARDLWLKVLDDGDDREALERLIDDAVEREDHTEATTLLRRLGQNIVDKAEKARVSLREAELLAEGVGDADTALARYEEILAELDPTCRPALQAIADLQEKRGEFQAATDALERELKLLADPLERGQIAGRLARLYEEMNDAKNAIRAFDIVRKADLEDYNALTRLCELCEKTEQWDRVTELLAERIEVEADEDEAARMTMKLANILADKRDKGDEALAALTEFADQGHPLVRQAYVELGDRLGWKGVVAQKLVDWWFDARHTPERTQALRSAFDRFAQVGREQDAVRVGIELVRTKGADKELAKGLEELAVKTTDQEALAVAHDLLVRDLHGADRAHELVRQAEVKARAGVAPDEAMQHGEEGLASIAASDAEPLLDRLSRLTTKPSEVADLYERQIGRAKAPADRVRALARAAQVAGSRGQPDRARGFFELALAGAPTDAIIASLETAAREGDQHAGGDRLRRALVSAMAAGGHGARDGGRTRASLLRRAASVAHKELNDNDQAFRWLGESLVAFVDQSTLDELEKLGIEISDPRRTEAALSHALNEVFDGPLVRQLLERRARLRRDQLVDKAGAAQDLKRLHDLSPADHAVFHELAAMLLDLADYRGLVQFYEDQILRGRDTAYRAELARKVARLWEEQLQDAREAADAWRRVLRMKAGDTEAQAGLDRAKAQQLQKSAGGVDAYLPPPPPNATAGQTAATAARPAATEARTEQTGEKTAPKSEAKPVRKATSEPPKAPIKPRPPSIPPAGEITSSGATIDGLGALTPADIAADRVSPAKAPAPPKQEEEAPKSVRPSPPAAAAAPAPPKSVRPAATKKASPISNILDEEIAMSLERLGTPSAPPAGPSSRPPPLPGAASAPPPADLADTSDDAAIDAGLAALDSQISTKKHEEEVIDADELAEFVEGEDDLHDA